MGDKLIRSGIQGHATAINMRVLVLLMLESYIVCLRTENSVRQQNFGHDRPSVPSPYGAIASSVVAAVSSTKPITRRDQVGTPQSKQSLMAHPRR